MRLPPNQLIELVRCSPALWDTSHPEYCRSPVSKEIKWREISAALDMPTQLVKSKWKNLRDAYAKHLRSLAGDDESGRFRTYAWSKDMEFLAPYLSVRVASVPLRPGAVVELLGGAGAGGSGGAPRVKLEHTLAVRRRRRRQRLVAASARASAAATASAVAATATSHPNPTLEPSYKGLRDLNANELIFHGYAKIVNRFSARRQLETRTRIMQVLAEQELRHLQESAAEDSSDGGGGGGAGAGGALDPLVAKTEPCDEDDDDDSHYFES